MRAHLDMRLSCYLQPQPSACNLTRMRAPPDVLSHADLGAWNSNARKRAWIRDFLFAFGRGEGECVADAVSADATELLTICTVSDLHHLRSEADFIVRGLHHFLANVHCLCIMVSRVDEWRHSCRVSAACSCGDHDPFVILSCPKTSHEPHWLSMPETRKRTGRCAQVVILAVSFMGIAAAWTYSVLLMTCWVMLALVITILGAATTLSPVILLRLIFIVLGLQVGSSAVLSNAPASELLASHVYSSPRELPSVCLQFHTP